MIRLLLAFLLLAPLLHADFTPVTPDTPAWHDLFTSLSADHSRRADFEERRTFPSRNRPVILTGTIRISPTHGLSLHYEEPTAQTMIVDDHGVLLRNARGRTRNAPNDSRTRELTAGLAQILRFNLTELARSFVIRGERRPDATWSLEFAPRHESLAESLTLLRVEGRNTQPAAITLTRPNGQRIEIELRHANDDVTFTAAELKRFFR